MKNVRIFAWLGAIIMAAMIVFSFITGDFAAEGSILVGMVWGQMSLVDLYVGFLLFYLWIWYREKSLVSKLLWFVLLMTTGSLATALYILYVSYNSQTKEGFFFGKNV